MNLRHGQPHVSTARKPVLLVGPDSRLQAALAQELHALRMPMRRADSLRDALADRATCEARPAVVLIPDALIDPDRFEEEHAEFQIRTGAARCVPIAIGRRPTEERRRALRESGVRLALFGRFGRHALRFQLNRALSAFSMHSPRGDRRAPMEWKTQAAAMGQRKNLRCYSLSTRGAYFATPRPWVVGSVLSLELPFTRRDREVWGRVLYTRNQWETTRPELPGGMGVTFQTISPELRAIIERDLAARACGLEV